MSFKRVAPTKKIHLLYKDNKLLSKLLLLHNNLMQIYNIPYEESLIDFSMVPKGKEKEVQMLLYYEPIEIYINNTESDAYIIHNMLVGYIETGLLTQEQMNTANKIWKKIQPKADL